MKNNTTSSFSNSPSNTTVALHSELLTVWFIGRGDSVRYVTVASSNPKLTMAQSRMAGSGGLEIMVDTILTPAQARRQYAFLMKNNVTLDLGFTLDPAKYERNGIEYFLIHIKKNKDAHNPEYVQSMKKP